MDWIGQGRRETCEGSMGWKWFLEAVLLFLPLLFGPFEMCKGWMDRWIERGRKERPPSNLMRFEWWCLEICETLELNLTRCGGYGSFLLVIRSLVVVGFREWISHAVFSADAEI